MSTASVKDVAERAGLSVGTVSNVLNHPEKVSEETRARVLEAIDVLGFVRNEAARQLRAGMSTCVGVIVLNASNPFFNDVVEGAESWAMSHGMSVLVGNSGQRPEREHAYFDLFEQQRVRGLLVSPIGDVTKRLNRLRKRGIATVVMDRVTTGRQFSSVSVDDVLGGRLAARHLAELGHTRLAFVGGPLTLRQIADRFEGAAREVGEHPGVQLEYLPTDDLTIRAGRAVAATIMARPAASRPQAVFAANDLLALGLLQGLTATRELRVPDDIALIGYDDIEFAAGAAVPLSSIAQPRQQIGERAMELLLRECDDPETPPETIVLKPELVVRASTDPRLLPG